MNKKAGVLLVFVLLGVLLLSSSFSGVLAQLDLGDLEGVEEGIEAGTDIIKEEKGSFLWERWKEYITEDNPVFSRVNWFLDKVSPVFLFLLARPYELSMGFFFAVVLWLFTLFSIERYMVLIPALEEGWQQFLPALGATVVLAHTKAFNYLSIGINKILFYRKSSIWVFMTFLVVIVFVILYYKGNSVLAKYLKARREKGEKAKLEERVERGESVMRGIKEAAK
jgi:hypothetical protein